MTLIAGTKFNNQGIILADYRLTICDYNGKQTFCDIANKAVPVGDSLLVCCAGNVGVIPSLKPILKSIEPKLDYQNVDRRDGKLFSTFENFLFNPTSKKLSKKFVCEFLIVHLNTESDTFKMFTMSFCWDGKKFNSKIEPDCEKKSIILGSGKVIQCARYFNCLDLAGITEALLIKGFDLFTIKGAIESEILSRLHKIKQEKGGNYYDRLGIGPVFLSILIEGSSLKILGVDVKGTKIDLKDEINKIRHWHYSFEKNEKGDTILKDYKNNQTLKTYFLDDVPHRYLEREKKNNKFEPMK